MSKSEAALQELEMILIKAVSTAWAEADSSIRRGHYRTAEQAITVANTALADLFRVMTLPRERNEK